MQGEKESKQASKQARKEMGRKCCDEDDEFEYRQVLNWIVLSLHSLLSLLVRLWLALQWSMAAAAAAMRDRDYRGGAGAAAIKKPTAMIASMMIIATHAVHEKAREDSRGRSSGRRTD
jgi:hypothetical protein